MHYRYATALLALALTASCHKEEQILCGDPVVGAQLSYEIADAATGQDWYAGPGRPSGDSLRLLASPGRPAVPGQRVGSRVQLGPLVVTGFEQPLLGNSQRAVTHYLGLGNGDIDTVRLVLHYAPEQPNPCGYPAPVNEITVTYNGRPNGVFRASEPADSLSGGLLQKVVRLLKR